MEAPSKLVKKGQRRLTRLKDVKFHNLASCMVASETKKHGFEFYDYVDLSLMGISFFPKQFSTLLISQLRILCTEHDCDNMTFILPCNQRKNYRKAYLRKVPEPSGPP